MPSERYYVTEKEWGWVLMERRPQGNPMRLADFGDPGTVALVAARLNAHDEMLAALELALEDLQDVPGKFDPPSCNYVRAAIRRAKAEPMPADAVRRGACEKCCRTSFTLQRIGDRWVCGDCATGET